MNKKERTELVFKTLSKIVGFEIKPNKEFYMVGNGGEDVYLIDEFLNLLYKSRDGSFQLSVYDISLIFKGELQLEEIKEPLLTEGRNYIMVNLLSLEKVKSYYDEDFGNDIEVNYNLLKNGLEEIEKDPKKTIILSFNNLVVASTCYIKNVNGVINIYVVEEDDEFDYNGNLNDFMAENMLFYDIEIIE